MLIIMSVHIMKGLTFKVFIIYPSMLVGLLEYSNGTS